MCLSLSQFHRELQGAWDTCPHSGLCYGGGGSAEFGDPIFLQRAGRVPVLALEETCLDRQGRSFPLSTPPRRRHLQKCQRPVEDGPAPFPKYIAQLTFLNIALLVSLMDLLADPTAHDIQVSKIS